jgi:tetratricopeptide (TPR) repeat protein
MVNIKFVHPRYYRLLAGLVIAGAIVVPLLMLENHHASAPAAVSSSSSTAPSSGNSTADRVHELKALEEELAKKPEHPPILLRMAQISSDLGKPADAISYLQRLVKADPKNVDGRLELGRLLYENNDVQGSMRETSKILELNPKQVDALYNMGAIYANLNNSATARAYWNRAVASDPGSDSGKRAREGLEKLNQQPAFSSTEASRPAEGWTHPAVHQ